MAAEGVNAAAVATEKTRAEAAEGVLTTDLASLTSTVASNKTASESADTSATTDRASIRSEYAAADTALESSLQSNIDAEKARLDVLEGDSSTPGSVAKAIADLVDGADAALDTLKELGEALGDDADFAATITSSVASVQSALDTFIARTDNPHSVTAVQLGVEKGVDVQAYDEQLDSITNLYHPGEKKQVISWYTYQSGQTPTPSYEEFGVFTSAPIKEGINTNYLSGSSGSIYGFTYKYELLRTDAISSGTGTYELTLPQIQDADEGRMMVLKVDGMQDSGSNPVAIKFVADAADSIDGAANFTLDDSYQALSLVASKSFGWQIV